MKNLSEIRLFLEGLPDVYPDFVECTIPYFEEYDIADEGFGAIMGDEGATTESVLVFIALRLGWIKDPSEIQRQL